MWSAIVQCGHVMNGSEVNGFSTELGSELGLVRAKRYTHTTHAQHMHTHCTHTHARAHHTCTHTCTTHTHHTHVYTNHTHACTHTPHTHTHTHAHHTHAHTTHTHTHTHTYTHTHTPLSPLHNSYLKGVHANLISQPTSSVHALLYKDGTHVAY